MRSEWREVRLEDITSKIGDGLHGTPKYDDNGEYYFINGNNIGDGKITINENTKRINYQEYLKHKKELTDRTILVSINGTLGSIGLYNNENVCLGKSACYLNTLEEVEKEFVKYILTSNYFQDYIHVYATGTTIKNMGLKAMRDFTFKLPPLPTQKKIAHILSTLDDKIELNRKMNQTLEEMAQAIFKSWFVDFDPVHAKVGCANDEELKRAARELGISKEVLELFPSEFEESELGMIPEGWKVQSIYDVANIVYGAPFSSKNFNDTQTGRPLIRIRDLKTFNSQHWTEEEHVKGTLIKAGDLLIGMDAEFTPTIWQGIDGWLNQRVLKVVPINGTFTAFQYFALKPKMRFFEQANVGTTVIHLGKKDIDTIKMLVPSREILEQSRLILEPLFKHLVHNSQQNRNLQNTRDTLLPKLLSGEMDVSGLEVEI